jgi:hypothetical protein
VEQVLSVILEAWKHNQMTDEQLYLVIGIPCLLSLLGILLNAALFTNFSSTLNARMTSFETSTHAQMASFEVSMGAREASMNARMAAFEAAINLRMASLEARMLQLENTFTTRFDLLMGRLTDLEKELHRRQ